MEKDIEVTDVKFLIEGNNEVFAFFPSNIHHGVYMTSYAHIGQHSACHPDYASACTPATGEQYKALKLELEGLGYNLNVIFFKNKTWTIRECLVNNKLRLMVYSETGRGHVDYPIQYENGSIAYEFPERVPAYIQKKVVSILNKK